MDPALAPIHLNLSPQRRDGPLALERRSSVLVFNGAEFDLQTPQNMKCEWLIGAPEFDETGWHVTIVLPHGADAPDATRFPNPIVVGEDGIVTLPDYGSNEHVTRALQAKRGLEAIVDGFVNQHPKLDISERRRLADVVEDLNRPGFAGDY